MDTGTVRRVRAGWTAPAAIGGSLCAVVGIVLLGMAYEPRNLCHALLSFQDLGGSSGSTAAGAPSCATADHRFDVAVFVTAAAAVITVVGLAAMVPRARASRRAGCPWAIAPSQVAAWIDRRLPGHRRLDGSPRISGGLVAVLAVVLLGSLMSGVVTAWDNLSHKLKERAYHRGQGALATLALPAGLSDAPGNPACHSSPDTWCGSSPLSPQQVEPILRRLLHWQPNAACPWTPPVAGPCPVTGEVGGYPAMGWASYHLVIVRDGTMPPPGATHVPGADPRMYYTGTDVMIDLSGNGG